MAPAFADVRFMVAIVIVRVELAESESDDVGECGRAAQYARIDPRIRDVNDTTRSARRMNCRVRLVRVFGGDVGLRIDDG